MISHDSDFSTSGPQHESISSEHHTVFIMLFNLQVEYLQNYEFLMVTTFKRAYPVKYTPGTTGKLHRPVSRHQG